VDNQVQIRNVAVERHVRFPVLVVVLNIVAPLRGDDRGVHIDGDLLLRFHLLCAADGNRAQHGESAHPFLLTSRVGQKEAEAPRGKEGIHGASLLPLILVHEICDGDERPLERSCLRSSLASKPRVFSSTAGRRCGPRT